MMQQRSAQKELLDLGPDYYTADEYEQCLRQLFQLNRWLGFLASTRRQLQSLPQHATVVDVGCGGGLAVLALAQQFPAMRFTGIDTSAEAIRLARAALQRLQQDGVVSNVTFARTPPEFAMAENSVDVVTATLLCHHLTTEELVGFLQKTLHSARHAVILHDLHRHPLAYWLYRWFCPLAFRNRLIRQDGLVSIQRAFTRVDWVSLLQQARITQYHIQWCFPFRWRVILWKKS